MNNPHEYDAPSRKTPESHQRGKSKVARIPVKVEPTRDMPHKPAWIRAKVPTGPRVREIKRLLRETNLSSVCEEAACPNLGECFSHGTATFMIMGDVCTRRCPFCDVAHGKPEPLDAREPAHLAEAVAAMKLRYVVITSVDRDDLRDGGAGHFADCIRALRISNPQTRIEILVPDFRGRIDVALQQFQSTQPDVFNHNLETVPRLYRKARPGADYQGSLDLLKRFAAYHPDIRTKSGLMLGLGERPDEVKKTLEDLLEAGCRILTLGQYLQPSREHLELARSIPPEDFEAWKETALGLGFAEVASGPFVRSSYHAHELYEAVRG